MGSPKPESSRFPGEKNSSNSSVILKPESLLADLVYACCSEYASARNQAAAFKNKNGHNYISKKNAFKNALKNAKLITSTLNKILK